MRSDWHLGRWAGSQDPTMVPRRPATNERRYLRTTAAGRDTLQSVRPGAPAAVELQTRSGYDASGRLNLLEAKTVGGNTWYAFGSPSYNLRDNLLNYSASERKPTAFETWTHSATYAPNGTGRLATAGKALGNQVATFSYDYDVFGNRVTDQSHYTYSAGDGCTTPFTSTFGSDNQLETRRISIGCSRAEMYWNDRAGNRLVQLDTTNGTYSGPKAIMSYTAKNQLFFSMTRTGIVGSNNDYNWHWYDATGMRVITQVASGTGWVPTMNPATLTTPRTYYVYDGNDVALVLVRSGGSWAVRQRYLTGGLDDQVAGRFSYGATTRNLALVRTRDGTTLTAVRADGTQEVESWYYSRDPFGKIDQLLGTVGTISSETGFTGASTPNQTGGFVYLRNRWYDPQTGRFLTQDPIGLAGGVNLYAYAGNNPMSFADPFGLFECTWWDRSDCPVIKIKVGVGLMPIGLKAKGGIGALEGSFGPKGAWEGEATFGTGRPRFSGRLVSGIEGTLRAKGGSAFLEGKASCLITTNSTGGCRVSSSAGLAASRGDGYDERSGEVSVDSDDGLGGEVKAGLFKLGGELNVKNGLMILLGDLIDSAREFLGTLRCVQSHGC